MIPALLTHLKTQDGITLDGIVIQPKRKSKTALIWLHGLSSNFASSQKRTKALTHACVKNNIAFLKFNTRGHDIAVRSVKKMIGAGFEKFTDCVYDIRAMIRFAKKYGYKNIILAGHSTGANKALYYIYNTRDRSVRGISLIGAISDIASDRKINGFKITAGRIRIAEKLVKKNPSALMPPACGIITASRYLSLYKVGSVEDVFPYHNPNAGWKELASIRIPISLIIGGRDEYLDIPLKKYIGIFRVHAASTKAFSSAIIKDANHSFCNREHELAHAIIQFINGL